jgi:very-short-patch-repair endonuclease
MNWQEMARRQAGAIDRRQLCESGVSEDSIQGLVARKELRSLLPGVYAHESAATTALQRMWAASLWSDGGIVSHRSAARFWRLPVDPTTTVHVTVGDRRFRRVARNVRLHRVPLTTDEITVSAGLPITTKTRTVIDLLRTERIYTARALLDRAIQKCWVSPTGVAESLHVGLGRTGNVQLRELLAGLEPGADAESERIMHRLLHRAGVTGWVPQYRVRLPGRSAYVDVAFPELKIAIEVDGRFGHDRKSERFDDDRERQNLLVGAGWIVLRFTWAHLTQRPHWVIEQIAQHLAA